MTRAESPALTFTGGQVLRTSGLKAGDLHLANGTIADHANGTAVDATGYLILPGIVDLHGDGFERHLAPRRGALESLDAGLVALDAELAANGITTAVLAQFWSWEGGMRGPDYAEAVAEALSQASLMTDIRLQLRLEINLIDDYPRALDLIDRFRIPYVVFNDHLPHEALEQGKRPPRLNGQALKSGRSPEAHLAHMQALHARRAEVAPALDRLAADLTARGVCMGSHDDHTPEDRARHRGRGARIAEFPETRSAAKAAHRAGDPVLMGAPNVVRGGSHDGKERAADLIGDGLVTALVSDYHYPALHRAAFRLADDGMPLAEAWALISTRPAEVFGLTDRGRLAPGQRADLVVIDTGTRRIEGCFVAGLPSFLSGKLAARWLDAAA